MAYAYAWTDPAIHASPDPKLEAHQRAALVAAIVYLDANVAAGHELPLFSWGTFSSPKNGPAREMAAAVESAIATVEKDPKLAKPAGSTRTRLLTIAVRGAYLVRSFGFGEAGWTALLTVLSGKPTPTPAPKLDPIPGPSPAVPVLPV